MFDWLFNWFQHALAWLKDLLLWLPLKIWAIFTDALASAIEAIPVPDWLANAGNMFGNIPPSVMYFAGPMHLGTGISIVCGAYVIRFFIRRIPVIG